MRWIKKRENQMFFSVTIIAVIVAAAPLFTRYCLLGHDSEYHLLRIEALKDQILMLRPFLRVNPLYFGGAGYASSMFYPDFLLFIPALMRVCGFAIDTSYHMYIFICIIFCYQLTYTCGKRITKNRYMGILFAVILTLSSYHLDDIHIRAAAGEYTAFIFIPLILYGLYNMFFEDFTKPWLLGFGMGFMLLSHTLSFIMCIVLIVILSVFNFDVFMKKPRIVTRLILTGLVTMAATAFYWVPVIEQFLDTVFLVSNPWIMPSQEAVKFSSIFDFTFPTLGVGLMILIIPRVLIFRNHNDSVMHFADQCAAAGVIFAIAATDILPWNKLERFLYTVQFPWRFYIIATVLFAFAAAASIYRLAGALYLGVSERPDEYDDEVQVTTDEMLVNSYGLVLGLVLIIMTIFAVYGYSNTQMEYYDYSNDYFSYKPYTATVIAGEWLPETVTEPSRLVEMSEHALDNNGNEAAFSRNRGRVTVTLTGGEEYVDVPLVYYKGYTAEGESGVKYAVDGSGENGLARVYTQGAADVITVNYSGTALQHISSILSIAAFAAVWIVLLRIKKRIKAERRQQAESTKQQ